MRVCLDEGILHGFVGLGDIAHVMKRDPRRAPLVPAHQFGVTLARFGVPSLGLESLDRGGSTAICFAARKARRLSSCHGIRLDCRNVYWRRRNCLKTHGKPSLLYRSPQVEAGSKDPAYNTRPTRSYLLARRVMRRVPG